MASVELKNVKKVYDKSVVAVQDFNMNIADGEFIVLVGPSGCGKSTALRMIAGLEEISGGTISIDGKVVNDVPPKDRDIAMVFQDYALYPHMTVYDNIAYGLKLRKFPKRVIKEKVMEAAEILDIKDLLKRKPKALSGGQRQRVAIGRAIVRTPKVFLMDEPLSNLDAKLRNQMRAEIIKLRRKMDSTFVYVTHDQTEAMTLGDRIVIMKDGFVQQIGTPREVFYDPTNIFVAGFIGTPQMNFFKSELRRDGETYYVMLRGVRVELPLAKQVRLTMNEIQPQNITLGVRPEHMVVAKTAAAFPATVELTELMGSNIHVHIKFYDEDATIVVQDDGQSGMDFAPGQAIAFAITEENMILFDENGNNLEHDDKEREKRAAQDLELARELSAQMAE